MDADTPRLHLTLMSPEYLDAFHRIWSDPEATQWSVRGICKTKEESRQWMNGILPQTNPSSLVYAVFVRPDTDTSQSNPQQHQEQEHPPSEMVGVVGVHRLLPSAEIGYIFHPSVWGRGYATEALSAFLALFWKLRPELQRVEAATDHENIASQRVLLKCGLKEVRRLKDECVLLNKGTGKRDVLVFEMDAPGGGEVV